MILEPKGIKAATISSFFCIYLADSVLGIQICNLLFINLVLYHQLSHLVEKLHKHHFEKCMCIKMSHFAVQLLLLLLSCFSRVRLCATP